MASAAPPVQVFGLEGDQATRAALRFFKERRVPFSFVDLRRRPIAPAELRRFVERLGAEACADTTGRAWRDAGLGYLQMTDEELMAKLIADPRAILAEAGVAIPAGVTVKVLEDTATHLNFVLPPKPIGQLSDEALDKVAAGDNGQYTKMYRCQNGP